MNQEWVSEKNAEQKRLRSEKLDEIRSILESKEIFTDDELETLMSEVEDSVFHGFSTILFPSAVYEAREKMYGDDKEALHTFGRSFFETQREVKHLLEELMQYRYGFEQFLDSEPVEFDGNIIITDPCYILKDGESHRDDWEKCGYGSEMENLGITHYMTRDTIYGDWSCSVYNMNTRRKIGEFCADAGLVSVFLLDEVLKYNPQFDYHINRKWTTALIKNFKGTVQFVVEEEPYEYDGEQYVDYCVRVVGHGINKRSGKPMDFIGTQTGL